MHVNPLSSPGRVRRTRVKAYPTKRWALAVPLVVMALAGCGGTSEASTPTASTATTPTPAESRIHQARHSCGLDGSVFSEYATLGDSDHRRL